MIQHSLVPLVAALIVAAATPVYHAVRSTAAVGGAYGLMAEDVAPPPPPSGGCGEDCRCNGTGKEKSGDGIIEFDCPCSGSADCKAKKSEPAQEPVCTSGTCGVPSASGSSRTVNRRRPILGRIFR